MIHLQVLCQKFGVTSLFKVDRHQGGLADQLQRPCIKARDKAVGELAEKQWVSNSQEHLL